MKQEPQELFQGNTLGFVSQFNSHFNRETNSTYYAYQNEFQVIFCKKDITPQKWRMQ